MNMVDLLHKSFKGLFPSTHSAKEKQQYQPNPVLLQTRHVHLSMANPATAGGSTPPVQVGLGHGVATLHFISLVLHNYERAECHIMVTLIVRHSALS